MPAIGRHQTRNIVYVISLIECFYKEHDFPTLLRFGPIYGLCIPLHFLLPAYLPSSCGPVTAWGLCISRILCSQTFDFPQWPLKSPLEILLLWWFMVMFHQGSGMRKGVWKQMALILLLAQTCRWSWLANWQSKEWQGTILIIEWLLMEPVKVSVYDNCFFLNVWEKQIEKML